MNREHLNNNKDKDDDDKKRTLPAAVAFAGFIPSNHTTKSGSTFLIPLISVFQFPALLCWIQVSFRSLANCYNQTDRLSMEFAPDAVAQSIYRLI